MEKVMFESVYEKFMIEFQRDLNRPLLNDEINFIEWLAKKVCEEYMKVANESL